jgi:hypothetical protein
MGPKIYRELATLPSPRTSSSLPLDASQRFHLYQICLSRKIMKNGLGSVKSYSMPNGTLPINIPTPQNSKASFPHKFAGRG